MHKTHAYLKFNYIYINKSSNFEKNIVQQIKSDACIIFKFENFTSKTEFDAVVKPILTYVKKHKIKFLLENNQYLTDEGLNTIHSTQLLTQLNSALTVDKVIRGGELIEYAGDIIVNNTIAALSDIKAGGNIIVNSHNQGRLFAGGENNLEARIYMRYFDNCFVSIAGVHKLIEDANTSNLKNKSVMIFLNEFKRIHITSFEGVS